MASVPDLIENTFFQHDRDAILLRKSVREYAKRYIEPKVMELDRKDPLDSKDEMIEIIKKSSEIRLLSLIVPEHLGGMGGLVYMGSNALEVLAYYDAGTATSIGAIWLGLLPVYIAGAFDGGKSWERWLKPFAEADEKGEPQIWAFAITEPTAGSDYERVEASAKPEFVTIAKPTEDGGFIITGRKVFISNSPIADHITVFAVTDKEDPYNTMMCAVVTKDMGFRIEQVYDKMGHRSSPTGEVVFDDVYVPKENVLCEPGLGWDYVKITLSMSRAPVGAIGLGIAKKAFEMAVRYATEREQGGKRLIDHQLIKYKLSRMLEKLFVAEHTIYNVSKKVDNSFPPTELEPSLAKAFGGDVAVEVALEALQIMGGYGYMKEMGVEKLVRDAKLIQIYEGTNEINRLTAIEELLGIKH